MSYYARYMRELRDLCRQLGLCGRCHKADATPGMRQCERCRSEVRRCKREMERKAA